MKKNAVTKVLNLLIIICILATALPTSTKAFSETSSALKNKQNDENIVEETPSFNNIINLENQEELDYALESGRAIFKPNFPTTEERVGNTQDEERVGVSASDVINIAKSQIGVSGVPNTYTYWLGSINGSYSYAWCHAFVSWCADQAGAGNLIPKTASCASGVQWFKNQGHWKDRRSGYIPKPGDFIYFDWNTNGGYDHVGLVNYVSNNRVYTIEGNARNAVKYNGGYTNGYSISDTQIIGYGTPDYDNVSSGLSCQTSGNQVYFNWTADSKASSYNLKIWKNRLNEGSVYKVAWGIKGTDYSLILPSGTYQAYIDGINTGYCQMSNVIEFTVEEENPKIKVQLTGNQAYFNWTGDSKATSYNLKVYRGVVWESDPYEIIWGLSATNAAMALPAGTYQAYVDAIADGYMHMGSIIEFTIKDDTPTLSTHVTGNQVYFNWTKDNSATNYDLKIYKGKAWNSPVYEVISGIETTDFLTAMPAGTYQAYIDATNSSGYRHMGNVIEFTVNDISPKLSASVNGNQVTFNWEKDSNATGYRLKIYNGHVWTSDIYKIINSSNTLSEKTELPAGTYQAYIDATNNSDYLQMGNVIEFTVTTKLISECTVNIDPANYIYDENAKTPTLTIKDKNSTLTAGTDYIVTFLNNINAGKATITITGKGNYTGNINKTFTISKANQTIISNISTSTIKEEETSQITANGQGTQHYASSDTSVATVSSSGTIIGKSAGSAVITVTADGNSNYFPTSTAIPITVVHDYDTGKISKPATCTENGIRTYTCSSCNKTYTEAIEATGHNYQYEKTEATCTERGFTNHTCSICGDNYKDTYIDALGHDFDDGVITTEATEEMNGTKTFTCSRCKETRFEVIPAINHTYDSGIVTKEATCTENGILTYHCQDCTKIYTVEIPSKGHNYASTVTAPTCTQKGYTTYSCTVCSSTFRDSYTDIINHTYNIGEVTKEATCTEEGIKTYTCTACFNQYTESIAAKGHQYEKRITSPTCTKKGYTTHTCLICKHKYRDTYTDATDHHYDEGEITDEPSCLNEGLKIYTCTDCKVQYTEDIPATGHHFMDKITAPTCIHKGYITHVCSNCGNSYKNSYINALGHSWDDGFISKTATEKANGIKTYTCTNCGETKDEIIPAIGKKPVPNKPSKPSSPTVGTIMTDITTGGSYKILTSNTAEYLNPINKTSASVRIPQRVILNGYEYQITSVAKNAFKNNKNLITARIGNNIKTIGKNAFSNCTNLKKVILGKNVTVINSKAFYKCKNLKKMTLPASVNKIGKQAFYGCLKLKKINIKTKQLTVKKVGNNAFKGIHAKAIIKAPRAKLKSYKKLLKAKGIGKNVKFKI